MPIMPAILEQNLQEEALRECHQIKKKKKKNYMIAPRAAAAAGEKKELKEMR